MNEKDWKVIGLVALAMAPITYYGGARASGWESIWGFPYLVANIVVPIVLAAIIYALRSNQKG